MVLRGLQSLLERLYDVELPYDVDDFLVTDRRAVTCGEPHNDRRAATGTRSKSLQVSALGNARISVQARVSFADALVRLRAYAPN